MAETQAAAEYVIVWSYRVEAARAVRFVAAYGPGGDWERLFHGAAGYRGSQLVRCEESGRYLTIDRWASKADFLAFLELHAAEYDELDDRCSALTSIEACIATGDAL